ncbi:MAG: hypothetical protein GF364_03360 [Candidatus Lokiarchaeota archaeon]|nr:hypothetical protein [Candidatus Lokiarchaeota archaeon]
MNKKAKVLSIIAIVLAGIFIPAWVIFFPNPFKLGWSGIIATNTTWEGDIYVSGDIVVAPWATLTIKPGTTISIRVGGDDFNFIAPNEPDDLQTGDPTVDANAGAKEYLNTHISISVFGKIICKGTEENPIRFFSEKSSPEYADWCGIYVTYGEFEYTILQWSVDGIFADENFERLSVDHCLISNNFAAGIGYGKAKNENSIAYVKHTTIQDCGHEAVDTHSSGDIEIAYNYIDSCQVGLNIRDDASDRTINANIHHNIIVDTSCPILLHNSEATVNHCVLQQTFQDTTRWTYNGWQMPELVGLGCINLDPSGGVNLLVKNTIIFDSPTGFLDQQEETSTSECVSDYNNFDSVSTPFEGSSVAAGTSNTYVSTMFIDKLNGDFRLNTGSPCKSAGDPAEGSPDLGAYGGGLAEAAIGWNPS